MFTYIQHNHTTQKKQPDRSRVNRHTIIDNNKMDIAITGIKLKYLAEKKNDYGTNHFFQVLDESPLK